MDHLTDAPAANILILAGVVFLAVAILGEVGGLLAKLFGPAKADLRSRAMAGLLGVALVVGGVKLHLISDAATEQSRHMAHRADRTQTSNRAAVAETVTSDQK